MTIELVNDLVPDLVTDIVLDRSLFRFAVPYMSQDGNLLTTADGSVLVSRGVTAKSSSKPKPLYVSTDGSLLATADGSLISR